MTINGISTINVKASGEYEVLIGRGAIFKAGEFIEKAISHCKTAVITDDTVDRLYSDIVMESLKKSGFEPIKFVFPHGENSKNLKTYGEILNFLAKNELTRTDAVIALGGGVVGDMAGFAAATYLRGIRYVQIPTTLLAQIDSSVGGKTAVDLSFGKNLVGAFCQPSLVLCDVNVLMTLPQKVFDEGMGEAAKYAVLDEKVYELIKSGVCDIEKLVYLSVDYKRRIVEADEFESGTRKLLNLGHTPAHGIEKLSGYSVPHGRAVAMGLEIILNASRKNGLIDEKVFSEIKDTITVCAGETERPYKIEDICEAALSDKKRSGDDITLIMIYGVGDCRPVKMKISRLKEYLA